MLMADLIDRQALLGGPDVYRVTEYDEAGFSYVYKAVPVKAIQEAPTVDAVEVVRCKDCKLRCPESISVYRHCALSGMMVDDDDFCSYGERRAADG